MSVQPRGRREKRSDFGAFVRKPRGKKQRQKGADLCGCGERSGAARVSEGESVHGREGDGEKTERLRGGGLSALPAVRDTSTLSFGRRSNPFRRRPLMYSAVRTTTHAPAVSMLPRRTSPLSPSVPCPPAHVFAPSVLAAGSSALATHPREPRREPVLDRDRPRAHPLTAEPIRDRLHSRQKIPPLPPRPPHHPPPQRRERR